MTSLLDQNEPEPMDFSDPMVLARFVGDFDSLIQTVEDDLAQLRMAVKPILKYHRKRYGKP